MTKRKGNRRQGRELAFQVLYGLNYVPARDEGHLGRLFNNCPREEGEVDPDIQAFAWDLVHGVSGKAAELNELITRFSQNWRIERIGKIELTILRLALFEMLFKPDIPLKVAINEAVELAKSFGDENSRNFVNGILDAVAKAVEDGDFGVHKKF